MKCPRVNGWLGVLIVWLCAASTVLAQSPGESESERLRELEELVQLLRQQNQSLQQRVGDLERDKAKPAETLLHPQAAAQGPVISDQLPVISSQPGAPSAGASSADLAQSLNSPLGLDQPLGRQSPVVVRGAFEDEQVSAPETSGHARFYYENVFFGSSGNAMYLRVRHHDGQVYNAVVGQTWSTLVGPDAFPDIVDYELANSSILTRSPLVRYIQPLNEQWQLNFGIEQPDSKVDVENSGGSSSRCSNKSDHLDFNRTL